jgi:archaellum component FlaC
VEDSPVSDQHDELENRRNREQEKVARDIADLDERLQQVVAERVDALSERIDELERELDRLKRDARP